MNYDDDFTNAKSESLGSSYSIRAAHLINQYGVGAMVNFPEQILMVASPKTWLNPAKLHDERLEKALHVDYFGVPMAQDGEDSAGYRCVSYVRFPEWYFCPSCHSLKPLSQWVSEWRKNKKNKKLDNDPYMIKHLHCSNPECHNHNLVVTRLVCICDKGHISDFPWVKWVHYHNTTGMVNICDKPDLKIKTNSLTGLEGTRIECKNCGAKSSLQGILSYNIFKNIDKSNGRYDFHCDGNHPWKNSCEECNQYPRTVLRGASSVYYPITVSSLIIPPYASQLNVLIEHSSSYDEGNIAKNTKIKTCMELDVPPEKIKKMLDDIIDEYSKKISTELSKDVEDIKKILIRKWSDTSVEYNKVETKEFNQNDYRREEYEALTGLIDTNSMSTDFVLEPQDNVECYNICGLKKVILVHKLKELRAMLGFSRVLPAVNLSSKNAVCIKDWSDKWYPGYEVRGEGIFLEFEDTMLNAWASNTDVADRVNLINQNYKKSYMYEQRPRNITAKFLLLHSLAHILIKQLSFECGYNIASLRERIYCNENASDESMSGILIYTASGDSEGTMGGLVRQGYNDSLPHIFRRAIENSKHCSNDPVCNLSHGQGKDALNLAACHACMLLPETSCEEFNSFLDRGVLIGTIEKIQVGFFNSNIDCTNDIRYSSENITDYNQVDVNSCTSVNKMNLKIIRQGSLFSGNIPEEVWDNLIDECEDDEQIMQILNRIKFSVPSKIPSSYFATQIETETGEKIEVDQFFPSIHLMIFLKNNKDEYEKAQLTGWLCYLVDENLDVVNLLKDIGG